MDVHKKGFSAFIKLCLSAKNADTLASVFDLFFTHEEISDLSLRYLIIRDLLQQEKSQREIASSLNVSIAKITRGSNELKRTNKKLLAYLKEKMVENNV